MQPLRILADDLTGALDTAGCFVGPGDTLPLIADANLIPRSGDCAVSTETRDIPESAALRRLTSYAGFFDGGGIAFKKIDSLLRGHVAAELAHIIRRDRFDAAVLAPAFPALGRVTRKGRQWAQLAGQPTLQLVGPDLAHDLARLGIEVQPGPPAADKAGASTVFLCDAETDDDLERVVDHGRRAGRVLWCGSAGLAEALTDGITPLSVAAPRALVICGTRHPVASLQVKQLCRDEPSALAALPPDYDTTATARIVNARLKINSWAAIAADFPDMPAIDARRLLDRALRDVLPRLDRPDALIVMGGDTLAVCNDVLGTRQLAVRGLLERGMAVSTFADGAWANIPVISKSGAFGSENTLREIIERLRCP